MRALCSTATYRGNKVSLQIRFDNNEYRIVCRNIGYSRTFRFIGLNHESEIIGKLADIGLTVRCDIIDILKGGATC